MTTADPLRVLFVAPDCNPEWHSLPALVAEYYTALEPRARLTLVTQARNEPNLSSFVRNEASIDYMDTERVERPVYEFAQTIVGDPNKAMTLQVALRYPSSLYFEYAVWRRYAADLRAGRFDIVHRVSPMSPTTPSLLAAWSPVPVVIGPILGGLAWPPEFLREMHREREWMNYVRSGHRLMPFYRATYRRAAAILAAYPHTVSDIPRRDRDRVIDFSEGGVWTERFPERAFRPFERATILFVGRMVPFNLSSRRS
jgi:glycosyltransferase involved in cell wall biosynthesis